MRRGIVGAAALALLLAGSFGPTARAAETPAIEEVRLLRSGTEEVVAEVLLPEPSVFPSAAHVGYHEIHLGAIPATAEPGAPRLPHVAFWIAVPPGASVSVEAEPRDFSFWEGIRPVPGGRPDWLERGAGEAPAFHETVEEDPALYAGEPAPWAEVGKRSRMRLLEVVPITVHPARWDPSDGSLRIARTVHIRVRFASAAPRAEGRAVSQESPSWERMYRGTVLNAEQARQWMRAPARRAALRVAATTDLVKLEALTTGLRRVTYEDLESLSWPGAGAPLADLRLFEQFWDPDDAAATPLTEVEVPGHIDDADASGTWTAGDALYFYAQHLYDRLPEAPWYLKRYGRRHVYWLGLRPGEANARMEATGTWLARNDLPVVASYPWREHFEKEVSVYGRMGSGVPGRDIDLEQNVLDGVVSVRSKHAYWQGGDPCIPGVACAWYSVFFDLPGFLSAESLWAKLQGFNRPPSGGHAVSLYLTRDAESDTVRLPNTPVSFAYQDSFLYTAGPAELAGMPLRERGNQFVHLETSAGTALVWFEVGYQRVGRFVDLRAEISTRSIAGEQEFRMASAPSTAIVGAEVTDPRAPRVLSIDPAVQIEQVGPARTLRLQWALDGSDRRFALAAAEAVPAPEGIALAAPADLAGAGDEDYVVIAPRAWIPTLSALIQHRESQAGGAHRALVAAIEDIYDAYSGGRRWPHAIRSYLRTLFRTHAEPPSFLLLVGDATDGFDNNLTVSAPNWVPTQTHFSNSFTGFQGRELVSSDQWFVDNLTGTGEALDFLPDMHVGRLTASDPSELEAMISKIVSYEQFGPEDDWRNRVLFVSDDAYSSSITFDESYRYTNIEELFATSARESALVIRRNGFVDMTIDTFFVACYMDSVPSLGRCVIDTETGRCQMVGPCQVVRTAGEVDYVTNLNYGGNTVAPLLWQAMSRGHLFVSFNGHANALLMTHEMVFRHDAFARHDVDNVTNSGRPFVFMGYGCHLAEFSRAEEALITRGDGLSERLLAAPGRAGIGAIASTGYEWLNTTDEYNLAVVRAFFENPPQFDGHTRWVLGEIVSRSKANIVARGPEDETYLSMSATYTFLGDPGLIMDAAGPRIAVLLDGQPIPSGSPLTLPAEQDSIRLEANVLDEVWARSFRIVDAHGDVPASRFTVTPDSSDDRRFRVSYTTTVLPRPYQVVLSAEDANGRVSESVFPVTVEAEFELRRGGDVVWQTFPEGERVLENDSVRVRLGLPCYLPASDLELLLDGDPLAVRASPNAPAQDGRAREWTVTSLDLIPRGGPRTLSFRVLQPDGPPYTLERGIETDPSFGIEAVYNVPNPFAKETWIFYRLGAVADEVSVRIYTTSGKLIRTLEALPGQPGLNEARWDGRDADGDAVANGLYFYKLFVKNLEGTASRIEKMARAR